MKKIFSHSRSNEKGQSLVEAALMLPILIIILAGLVEVSYLIITQNRISNASRAASGFASGNISDWEDSDTWSSAIGNAALNSVGQTMDPSPDLWDIWAIRAKMDANGTAFVEWEAVHVDALGNHQVISDSEWGATEQAAVQAQIITELQARGTDSKDLELVATATYFQADSLLGLPTVLRPDHIQSLNVMRLDGPAPYHGCDAFPIAVNWDSFSVYPPGVPVPPGGDFENYPTAGWSHWAGQDEGEPQPVYTDFPRNVPGVRLIKARPGYVFKVKDDSGTSGNFGWLSWDGCQSAGCVDDSLQYPGNSENYTSPGDLADDQKLSRYDLVPGASGNMASAWDTMYDNLMAQTGRAVKFLVFTPVDLSINGNPNGDANGDGFGSGTYQNNDNKFNPVTGEQLTGDFFEIYGYIVTKVWGGNKSQGQGGGFLVIEFLDWANDCGGLGDR